MRREGPARLASPARPAWLVSPARPARLALPEWSARLASIAWLGAAFAACGGPERPGLPPRNLVLVTIEGLRADHLSCYGYARPTTSLPSDPTQRAMGRAMGIDDLAASGVLFARAFAPSGSTTASLASLLTGRSPRESGMVDDGCALRGDVPTLASLLREAGFETAAFATARALPLERTLSRGFTTFATGDADAETVDAAIEWIARDFGSGRPRFLWLHLAGPEPPFTTEGHQRFADPDYRGIVDGSAEVLARASRGEITLSPADRARAVDLYDGGIAVATAELGRFLRRAFDFHEGLAESSETWSRTVLAIASPHGTELFEQGVFGHAAGLRDAELRVPLILRHPDSLTGQRSMAELVELADVAPTLLEWLEVPAPEEISGRSLLPLVDSFVRRPFARRPACAMSPERVYTARDARWRLVLNAVGAVDARGASLPPAALFDHETDPLETTDLSDAHPEVVAGLTETVRAFGVSEVVRARAPRRIALSPKAQGSRGNDR